VDARVTTPRGPALSAPAVVSRAIVVAVLAAFIGLV
jgi:hypothetical protein